MKSEDNKFIKQSKVTHCVIKLMPLLFVCFYKFCNKYDI